MSEPSTNFEGFMSSDFKSVDNYNPLVAACRALSSLDWAAVLVRHSLLKESEPNRKAVFTILEATIRKQIDDAVDEVARRVDALRNSK